MAMTVVHWLAPSVELRNPRPQTPLTCAVRQTSSALHHPRASSNARCEPKFPLVRHHGKCRHPTRRHARRFANTAAQSSEARLYTFSDETKTKLRKFRLGTSRAKDPQAVICSYTYQPAVGCGHTLQWR
jgi:hypothetical protein